MANVPQRKVFTTVESNFLEAGVQMDLAAQAEAPNPTHDAAPPSWWERLWGPSLWTRVVSLALGRWGAVGLVATGVFVIGAASFRGGRMKAPAAATLAVADMPTAAPLELDAGSRVHAITGAPAGLPATEATSDDTPDNIAAGKPRASSPAGEPHHRRAKRRHH